MGWKRFRAVWARCSCRSNRWTAAVLFCVGWNVSLKLIDVVGKSYLTLWYAESNKLTTNERSTQPNQFPWKCECCLNPEIDFRAQHWAKVLWNLHLDPVSSALHENVFWWRGATAQNTLWTVGEFEHCMPLSWFVGMSLETIDKTNGW